MPIAILLMTIILGWTGSQIQNVLQRSEMSTQQVSQVMSLGQSLTNTLKLLRAEAVGVIGAYGLSSIQYTQGLCQALNGANCPGPAPVWARSLVTPHLIPGETDFNVAYIAVSTLGSSSQWGDVQITPTSGAALPNPAYNVVGSRTVRLPLGTNSVFGNAMTGNTFQCFFCHSTIYGNVGEYLDNSNFTYSDLDTSLSSRVHGNWFTAKTVTPSNTVLVTNSPLTSCPLSTNQPPAPGYKGLITCDDKTDADDSSPDYFSDYQQDPAITPSTWDGYPGNPLAYSGNTYESGPQTEQLYLRQMQQYWQGPQLPWNSQRQTLTLPKLDPNSMMILAKGSIGVRGGGGSSFIGVPRGGKYGVNDVVLNYVSEVYDGNVILNGTNVPILIEGNVYVTGDVVIFGQVRGQGAIYAGRNIYIPDNLTYFNSPKVTGIDLFGGTQAANSIMTQMDDPVQRMATANTLANGNYDQLGLFATNSIIVGDPYPEDLNDPGLATDIRYIVKTSLDDYAGQLAMDATTGQMLDPGPVDPVTGQVSCFYHPWAKGTECLAPIDPSVHLLKNFTYAGANGASDPTNPLPTDTAYYLDLQHMTPGTRVSEAYEENFYPKNVTGSLPSTDWIQEKDFLSLVQNAAWVASDGDAPAWSNLIGTYPALKYRKRRMKLYYVPIKTSAGKSPYSPIGWDIDDPDGVSGIMNYVDNKTGLMSILAQLPADNDDTPNGALNARDRFKNWLTHCQMMFSGWSGSPPSTWTANPSNAGFFWTPVPPATMSPPGPNVFPPNSGLNNRTRMSVTQNDGSRAGGPAVVDHAGNVMTGGQCYFWYDSSYVENIHHGRSVERLWVNSATPSGSSLINENYDHNICDDSDSTVPECLSIDGSVDAGDLATGTTVPLQTVNLPPAVKNDPRTLFSGDITANIAFASDINRAPVLMLKTFFWDRTKPGTNQSTGVRIRNSVKRVDAFLFANQFITFLSDTTADRQIRVNGGLVARDISGLFVNSLGLDRNYTTGFHYPTAVQNYGRAFYGAYPGIIVKLDPRFEQSSSLVYASDFGIVSFIY